MNERGPADPSTVGPRRPSRQVLAIAATVLLAVVAGTVVAAVLLSGRTPQPGVGEATPSATATVTATVEPSPTGDAGEPSASATASPDGTPDEATRPVFQDEALATVRVNGLNVRADHSTAAPVLVNFGAMVRLNAGDHVIVLNRATWAEGRWWIEIATDRVRPADPFYDPLAIVGFVAAGTGADPWLEEDNAWCPGGDPSLAILLDLSAIERLGCYGSTSLTFTAYRTTIPPDAGLGGMCEPPTKYPVWLVCDGINYNWVNRDGGLAFEFLLHFDPATGIPPTGLTTEGSANPQVRITGHFDDPAAEDCDPMRPTTDEEIVQWGSLTCRTLFAVEQVN